MIIPEGDESEEDDSNEIGRNSIDLPPLTLDEWLTKWTLCAVLSPHNVNILLYQLGFDVFDDANSNGPSNGGLRAPAATTSEDGIPQTPRRSCLHCFVVGTPRAGKKRIMKLVGGGKDDNDSASEDSDDDGWKGLEGVEGLKGVGRVGGGNLSGELPPLPLSMHSFLSSISHDSEH